MSSVNTLSPLSKGYASWSGVVTLEEGNKDSVPSLPSLLPSKHCHGITVTPRAKSAVSGFLMKDDSRIPKTYFTRRGALVLFSAPDDLSNVQLNEHDKALLRQAEKRLLKQRHRVYSAKLGNTSNLIKSVLCLGDEDYNSDEASLSDPNNKLELGFLHSLADDNVVDKHSQPGRDLHSYLRDLLQHTSRPATRPSSYHLSRISEWLDYKYMNDDIMQPPPSPTSVRSMEDGSFSLSAAAPIASRRQMADKLTATLRPASHLSHPIILEDHVSSLSTQSYSQHYKVKQVTRPKAQSKVPENRNKLYNVLMPGPQESTAALGLSEDTTIHIAMEQYDEDGKDSYNVRNGAYEQYQEDYLAQNVFMPNSKLDDDVNEEQLNEHSPAGKTPYPQKEAPYIPGEPNAPDEELALGERVPSARALSSRHSRQSLIRQSSAHSIVSVDETELVELQEADQLADNELNTDVWIEDDVSSVVKPLQPVYSDTLSLLSAAGGLATFSLADSTADNVPLQDVIVDTGPFSEYRSYQGSVDSDYRPLSKGSMDGTSITEELAAARSALRSKTPSEGVRTQSVASNRIETDEVLQRPLSMSRSRARTASYASSVTVQDNDKDMIQQEDEPADEDIEAIDEYTPEQDDEGLIQSDDIVVLEPNESELNEQIESIVEEPKEDIVEESKENIMTQVVEDPEVARLRKAREEFLKYIAEPEPVPEPPVQSANTEQKSILQHPLESGSRVSINKDEKNEAEHEQSKVKNDSSHGMQSNQKTPARKPYEANNIMKGANKKTEDAEKQVMKDQRKEDKIVLQIKEVNKSTEKTKEAKKITEKPKEDQKMFEKQKEDKKITEKDGSKDDKAKKGNQPKTEGPAKKPSAEKTKSYVKAFDITSYEEPKTEAKPPVTLQTPTVATSMAMSDNFVANTKAEIAKLFGTVPKTQPKQELKKKEVPKKVKIKIPEPPPKTKEELELEHLENELTLAMLTKPGGGIALEEEDDDDEGLTAEEMELQKKLLQGKISSAKQRLETGESTQRAKKKGSDSEPKTPRKASKSPLSGRKSARKPAVLSEEEILTKELADKREARKLVKKQREEEAKKVKEALQHREEEKRRILHEAESKRKKMEAQAEAMRQEAAEQEAIEQAAREQLAEANRKAKEEREQRRKEEIQRKKQEAAEKRRETREREEAGKRREQDMLMQLASDDERKKMMEAERKRRAEEERRKQQEDEDFFDQLEEEERMAELRAEEEERRLTEAVRQAQEESMRRLMEEREEMNRRAREQALLAEQQALEEERLRLAYEDERKRVAEEQQLLAEKEQIRMEEERQRREELKRQEQEAFELMRQEIQKRKEILQKRQEFNTRQHTHLGGLRYRQGMTRPWIYSYYVPWPRETYERPIGGDPKKRRPMTAKTAR